MTQVSSHQQSSVLNIIIDGHLDFSILQSFRKTYRKTYGQNIEQPIKRVVIDMQLGCHLDSSGMGLLLSLKKELGLACGDIHVWRCQNHVKDILLAARMDHFFKID